MLWSSGGFSKRKARSQALAEESKEFAKISQKIKRSRSTFKFYQKQRALIERFFVQVHIFVGVSLVYCTVIARSAFHFQCYYIFRSFITVSAHSDEQLEIPELLPRDVFEKVQRFAKRERWQFIESAPQKSEICQRASYYSEIHFRVST